MVVGASTSASNDDLQSYLALALFNHAAEKSADASVLEHMQQVYATTTQFQFTDSKGSISTTSKETFSVLPSAKPNDTEKEATLEILSEISLFGHGCDGYDSQSIDRNAISGASALIQIWPKYTITPQPASLSDSGVALELYDHSEKYIGDIVVYSLSEVAYAIHSIDGEFYSNTVNLRDFNERADLYAKFLEVSKGYRELDARCKTGVLKWP